MPSLHTKDNSEPVPEIITTITEESNDLHIIDNSSELLDNNIWKSRFSMNIEDVQTMDKENN